MTVTKEMSIGEVLRMDKDTSGIFLSFGMSCLGCPHATMESIQDACGAHGTDAEELTRRLNEFFAQKA
ncbi:MAG: DUF1858 domain-containing protein [Clostridia bacterium]|nr:DUF1858 domain-containing protein [Clostridia bacterium]